MNKIVCIFGMGLLLLLPVIINGETHECEPCLNFLNSFQDQYHFKAEVVKGVEILKRPQRLSSNGLNGIVFYRFKAKKPITGKKRFYLQFRLSVYRYLDAEKARNSFVKSVLKQKNTVEYMRSKSPMLILMKGRGVYILDGSCQFARKNIDAIELKLINILYPDNLPENKAYLKRICGGFFQKINKI